MADNATAVVPEDHRNLIGRRFRFGDLRRFAAQAAIWTTPLTAASISATASSGWETIATWPDATSMVVAPMRLANERSASGGMASSFVATMYHEGSAFH